MDSLFVFCFKSCLKGDHDTEYYDVLQIDNSSLASTDLIKKQYKRLSLELHPDKLAQRGVEVTPEQKQRFLRVKEAYDVLSDPRRRRLYDQLGASGLKIIEHPTEVDPLTILRNYQKNGKERVLVFLLVACAFASLLVLPVLFSLMCDGSMGSDSSWVAIWTPMWIVDFVQLLSAVLYVLLSSEPESSSSNEEDAPTPAQRVPLVDRLNYLSSTVLFALVQIFVLIRLDRVVVWSWFVTFIPWYLYEMLSVANEFQLAVMTTVARPDFESIGLMEDGPVGEEEMFMLKVELENKYFEQVLLQQEARNHVITNSLRLWLAVFLALQLDHRVDWNWGLVLLPVWVYLCIQFGMAVSYRSWGHRKMAGIDEEAVAHGEEKDPIKVVSFQQGSQLSSTSLLICLAQCGPLFMAVLLVCRLQPSSHFTTFIILLPVFAFIGCCCCAVFCGICCLSCVDMDGLAEPPVESSSADGYSPPDPLRDVVSLGEVSLKESLPSHESSEGSAVHAKAISSTQIDVDID